MAIRATAISSSRDPIEDVTEAIPLIIPSSMWEILVLQSEIENCAPGEVLDRALSEYLDANGGERVNKLRELIEKRRGR